MLEIIRYRRFSSVIILRSDDLQFQFATLLLENLKYVGFETISS